MTLRRRLLTLTQTRRSRTRRTWSFICSAHSSASTRGSWRTAPPASSAGWYSRLPQLHPQIGSAGFIHRSVPLGPSASLQVGTASCPASSAGWYSRPPASSAGQDRWLPRLYSHVGATGFVRRLVQLAPPASSAGWYKQPVSSAGWCNRLSWFFTGRYQKFSYHTRNNSFRQG